MISWPLALAFLFGAFIVHLQIVERDWNGPEPADPYSDERRRNGESPDPDREVSPDPRFPDWPPR